MSQYWKLDPARWIEGCSDLTPEQELAYFHIINWTHLQDDPPKATDKVICTILKVRYRNIARRLVNELVDAGKIYIKDGRIHNRRADEELEYRKLKSRRQRAKDKPAKNENNPGKSENTPNENQGLSEEDSAPISREFPGISSELPGISGNSERDNFKSLKTKGAADNNSYNRIEENRITPIVPLEGTNGHDKNFDSEFETFFAAYPKRPNNPRKPALKSYTRARKQGASQDEIMAGLGAYAAMVRATGKERTEFVAQAATWLNQERWKDDYAIGSDDPQAEARRRLEEFRTTGKRH